MVDINGMDRATARLPGNNKRHKTLHRPGRVGARNDALQWD